MASRWLHDEARPGDRLRVDAPAGTFVFSGTEWPTIVLIGGGVGITPMMSIVRYLTDTDWPGTIYLLLSFKTPRDFIFADEIAALERNNPRLRVATVMSAPSGEDWAGPTGHVDARFINASVADIGLHRVHVCGPTPMMEAVKDVLRKLGVPPDRIKIEAFGTAERRPVGQLRDTGKLVGRITFLKAGKTVQVHEGATVLNVAETAGIFIDNACRSGTCGTCMVKMNKGGVGMLVEDALGEDDRKEGYILACQAKPTGDLEVET